MSGAGSARFARLLVAVSAVAPATGIATGAVSFSGRTDPQGASLFVTAIDATGSTAGGYRSATPTIGFLWDNPSGGGSTRNLDNLVGAYNIPHAFSGNSAFVVGEAASASGQQAARWASTGGAPLSLGSVSGGLTSIAWSANADATVIVGETSTTSGTIAFRWTSTTGMQPLGAWTIGGGSSHAATAITPNGSVVVGYGRGFPAAWDVFRWTAATGYQNLTAAAGIVGGGQPFAVSDDGSVIVGYEVVGTQNRAFRWTSAVGFQNLGVFSGGNTSLASDVSADGSIVVGSANKPGLGGRAFLWTNALGMVDLNIYLPTLGIDLTGWDLWSASGISADGTTIVGQGTHNGVTYSMWSAHIPTPGAGGVLMLGGAWMAGRRRRGMSL